MSSGHVLPSYHISMLGRLVNVEPPPLSFPSQEHLSLSFFPALFMAPPLPAATSSAAGP